MSFNRLTNEEINSLSIWDKPVEQRMKSLKADENHDLYDSFVLSLVKFICPEKVFSIDKTDKQVKASQEFDDLAFAEALEEAVKRFDKSKSKFLTFFRMLYTQNTKKNFIAESDVNITKEVVKLAKDVQLLHQKEEVSYSTIIDELKKDDAYKSYTSETWGKVYYYLEGGLTISPKSQNNGYDGDDESEELDFEDTDAEISFKLLDKVDECINKLIINIGQLTTAKETVFYKLYYTMLIMSALKGGPTAYIKTYPAGDKELFDLLNRYELDLENTIFDQDYIEFIIDSSPEDIKTLYGAYYNHQIRPINKKSIAQFYGNCSQANVTQTINRILLKIDI